MRRAAGRPPRRGRWQSPMPTSSARISSAAVVSTSSATTPRSRMRATQAASAAASRRIDVAGVVDRRRPAPARAPAIGGAARPRATGSITGAPTPSFAATRPESARNSITPSQGEQHVRHPARAPRAPPAAPPAARRARSVTRSREMRIWSAWLGQHLAPLRLLDLAGARQQRVEIAVFLDQLRRGLDADAGRARARCRPNRRPAPARRSPGRGRRRTSRTPRPARSACSSACRTSRCRARPAASGPCRR